MPTIPSRPRPGGRSAGKALTLLLAAAAVAVAAVLGLSFYFSSASIHELLTENHRLNNAIRNLTAEESIGYAVVREQGRDQNGRLFTELRFVQTAAGNPHEIVSEQLFRVSGDVVHFDALIVKFSDDYVKDGKERALYLWRRIYGEHTPPDEGQAIEAAGAAPERYHAISKSLRLKEREVFWEAVWHLADDPARLAEYGVSAVFGNAVYTRMRPGRVYRFKIDATGQIHPEVEPTP